MSRLAHLNRSLRFGFCRAAVVRPSVPAKSLKELIAPARRNRQLIFACQGKGRQHHLLTELFKTMADIDIKLAQFKGGDPAMVDLLGATVMPQSARSG